MHWFQYEDGRLLCEDVPLQNAAEEYGTPLFVYSQATIERHIHTIDGAFNDVDHLTCYSVKANANRALLKILTDYGLGADIVSGGELFRALRAGIPANRIVYSGVGKTDQEIQFALESGILALNVESESELRAINRIAGNMNKKAPVSFRINPDVDPKTHPYTSTGLKKNKFGIPHSEALKVYKEASAMSNITIVGIDAHIGSQLIDVSPYREATELLVKLVNEICELGIDLKFIDIGGGLGIKYGDEEPPDPSQWAHMIIPALKKTGCKLIIEPGRSLIGNAGILLTRVLYIKTNGIKTFVIVDAAMNDLFRPSLYGSYHDILPVTDTNEEKQIVDVVGPICESGDFIAKDRIISMPKEGDLLAIMSAGAYGMSMSSNYNSRPRAAEVLINRDTMKMVGRRETYDDLIGRETD